MANITTYLENKLLEHSLKGNWTTNLPTTTYAGLFIVSPTVTGTDGTEVGSTDAGYSRKTITWGTATSGAISNTVSLAWSATGYWAAATGATASSSITTIGIFDSLNSSGSNKLLWFGPLSTSITMGNGDSFTIPVGNLNITLL
jgi:hypothetical protein